MKDIFEADVVEIQVDSSGKTWINIDQKCELRVGRAKVIILDDPERGRDVVFEER